MNKKSMLVFAIIYLLLYILNYLHPMSFGDDYLYSFVWQGKPMNIPLDEHAVRVSSWHDLFASQWSHYFTWGGRTVAHVLAQFFLWMGKDVFNYFNAFVGTLLVAEIYWCIHKGKISSDFQPKTICWIFFVLWSFTPGFSPVFFWLTAACNYLWTNVILLAFLLPYFKKYFLFSQKVCDSAFFVLFMFLFGVIAGWTNENSVCWIIFVLFSFIVKYRKRTGMERWLYSGLVGMIIGYALLIFAPGNAARLYAEQIGGSNWLNLDAFKANLNMFLSISFFQIFLWFFCCRSIFTLKLKNAKNNKEVNNIIFLVKILCFVAFGMTAIMFFSPGFPPRSGFPGTVMLVIAAGMLINLQEVYHIELILSSAKKFLFYVASLYFVMTTTVTIYFFNTIHKQMQAIALLAQQEKAIYEVIALPPVIGTKKIADRLSGFHVPSFELSEDENDWTNVAFSRYYGIKGVRMLKKELQLPGQTDKK